MLLEAGSPFLDSWTRSQGWDNQEEFRTGDAFLGGPRNGSQGSGFRSC